MLLTATLDGGTEKTLYTQSAPEDIAAHFGTLRQKRLVAVYELVRIEEVSGSVKSVPVTVLVNGVIQ